MIPVALRTLSVVEDSNGSKGGSGEVEVTMCSIHQTAVVVVAVNEAMVGGVPKTVDYVNGWRE